MAENLINAGWDAGYYGEYVDFVEACCDGVATKSPVSEAVADLLVIRAMFAAAAKGTWEPVAT